MSELTDQERIWIEALKQFWPKAKAKGWKISKSSKEYVWEDGEIMTVLVLDPSGNKHFLKVSKEGEVYFASCEFVCV